ncbi:hypothetical protein FB451DRAFT_1554011 [Mycena latifolia]|nr:hypothetical protein FB451DRAFT_1554011 [Mycena latifolia]
MRSFLAIIFTLASLGSVLGRPVVQDHRLLRRLDVGESQCFTRHAAISSDCQALLANLPSPDWTNIATTGSAPIFKPFCSGTCCIFTDTKDVPTDTLVSAGTTVLGCVEPANGLVNGVTKTETSGICMADTTGANGCFQDS